MLHPGLALTPRQRHLTLLHRNAHERERATLQDRRELYDRQTERVAALFAENETAMTSLTKTAAALAEAKIGGGQADLTVDQAMNELEALAARAKHYE